MTEREKMIEIVLDTEITGIKLRNITGGISTANAIADALIAAGYGDVQSLADGTCVLYVKDKGIMRFYNEQDINEMIHRAMVAERKYMIALNKYAKCDRKLTHCNKMTTTYDKEITEQVKREIEEEGEDG